MHPLEHHHFQCTTCRTVIEFSSPHTPRNNKQFTGEYSAQVESASIMLSGRCPDCLDGG